MHPTRPMRLALLFCTLLPLCAKAADTPAPALDRPHSLLNSFDVMCNLEPPSFEQLSAKAAAMHLKTLDDSTQATPTGESMQTRSWLGMLTTGAFALRIEKMSNYTRDGWTLMVRDFERPGGHFVQVKLLAMAKAGAPQ